RVLGRVAGPAADLVLGAARPGLPPRRRAARAARRRRRAGRRRARARAALEPLDPAARSAGALRDPGLGTARRVALRRPALGPLRARPAPLRRLVRLPRRAGRRRAGRPVLEPSLARTGRAREARGGERDDERPLARVLLRAAARRARPALDLLRPLAVPALERDARGPGASRSRVRVLRRGDDRRRAAARPHPHPARARLRVRLSAPPRRRAAAAPRPRRPRTGSGSRSRA